MRYFLFATILLSLTTLGLVSANLILSKDGKPELVLELPDPTVDPEAVLIEGYFAPLFVVEKWYLNPADENGNHTIAKRIVALMHNQEHVVETRAKARADDNVILVTLHPDMVRKLKATFPDRSIIEVMPDSADTRRRAGNSTYKLNAP